MRSEKRKERMLKTEGQREERRKGTAGMLKLMICKKSKRMKEGTKKQE